MRRILVVVAIQCLWMAIAAAAQEKPTKVPGIQWSMQAPTRIDVKKPVGKPGPITPPGVTDGTGAGDAKSTAETSTTVAAYSFFFSHLDHLYREGDKQEALGNKTAATVWRTHEQLAAGLTTQEGNSLKQVADDCNQALTKKDAEIREAADAFHKKYPNAVPKTAQIPPELQILRKDRIQIITQHIDQLQSLLGKDRFLALDSYIHATFFPVTVTPVAITEKGKAQ